MRHPMYTEHANAYAKAVQDNIYNAHLERPSLLSLLNITPGERVLDLGCGSGEHAKAIQGMGGIVTCIDQSKEMISIARENAQPFKAYVQDVAIGLPAESSAQYDWVIAPLMIHYIKDFRLLFNEIRRVLNTNGHFVFSTHHPINDFSVSPSGNYFATEQIVETWDTVGEPVTVRFYRRSLQALFSAVHEAGFTVSVFSEGRVSSKVSELDRETYLNLTTKPSFIYMHCIL
ncbi:class I SAM-dependent methyltransferase [Vibrio ezurae]|uniref:Putative methyltransferase n=1 Tax=Vibrio ezurae NBRC 102218 TaxID=1219080 RepID=U3B3E6_9VIBR|nr:class I SAM-dependent methyltransferase [Vibrio ezurae]GAD79987.1 putative methyltransferase [Vibrio ezurae NBRC 102218]